MARPLPRPAARQAAAAGRPSQWRDEQPWDILLIAAAALILIGVARVHSFVPGISGLRPALLVFVVGVLALAANHRGARSLRHLKSPLGYLMAFVFIWAMVGIPFSIYQGGSFRFFAQIFLRTGLVVLVIAASVRNVTDLERLLKTYALGAIIFAVMAQGTGGMRAIGAGGYDPNDSAMFLVSALPLVFYFLIRAKSLPGRLLFGLGLLACLSAVVLSGSRGGFLALIAVMVFSLFFLKGIKPVVRAVVIAGAIAVISVQATDEFWDRMETITAEDDYNRESLTGRVELWKRGVGYMVANPIVGVGIRNFSVAEARHPIIADRIRRGYGTKYSAAHSIWVQIGTELGIPGLLALIGIFFMSIRMLWSVDRLLGPVARGDPELRAAAETGRPLIGLLVGLAVAGTFLSQAYEPLLWVGFGLVLAVVKVVHLRRLHTGVARNPAKAQLLRARPGPRIPRVAAPMAYGPRPPTGGDGIPLSHMGFNRRNRG